MMHFALTEAVPTQNFEAPILMLDKGCAAFNPVTVVQVVDAINHSIIWCVDMAADHASAVSGTGIADHGLFKPRYEFDGLFDLVFQKGRQ